MKLHSLLSLLEPIRIETATYRELFDYSRDYDLATVRDIREVRKEVVKLLTVGNGKRLSDNVDASIAALKDQEIEMFNRVQQQELYMMNLRTADKIRKAALPSKAVSPLSTPGQSSMTEESHLLKQLDVRGQNLRKLCEAEEQLTLEETEEEQEREQQLLIQELKRLEQQIKDKQQLDDSQDPVDNSSTAPSVDHLDTIDTIVKSIQANHNRATLSTIECTEQYITELQQQTEITPSPTEGKGLLSPVDHGHQLKSVFSDAELKEKWLTSMKALCKQLMPDHIMGKTAGRLLEILIHQPNATVSIDILRKEFPPEREKRHQLALVILVQLEAKLITMNEDTISVRL
ncbi:hypothetical protein A0J61_06935 [Choanephora cucurbitarum]|uniref:Uncharacterized protein n=1 Tax=Choanephora cucurbitarum TaxID=101091 RepID=A0A1C7N7D3_9FUNG|nr:hypothetical protein A0J61_06935 [Choanephora cucurbitarum]